MEHGSISNEAEAIERLLLECDPANGDDAALLRVPDGMACISTDSTVAGVHAPASTTPEQLGRRAVARALSDLAAMGASASAITCAVLVPNDGWGDAVAAVAGARARAGEQGARLIGGDLARAGGGPLSIVVTVIGTRAGSRGSFVRRDGMRAGDELWVTGTLGAATYALARGDRCLPEPPDRLRAGRLIAPHARAMLDLSDGIARDVRTMARASGCDIHLGLDDLPLASGVTDPEIAALGGDDYELLVAFAPGAATRALHELRACGIDTRLTRIGSAADGVGAVSFLQGGRSIRLDEGFIHR